MNEAKKSSMAAFMLRSQTPAIEAQVVAIEQLHDNPANPRADLGDLTELADSMKAVGILEPLLVSSAETWAGHHPDQPAVDGWVILAGHRRVAAAREAGLTHAPVIVRDDLADPAQTMAIAVMENNLRADLRPLEEARAFQAMTDSGMSQRAVAAATGRAASHVNKRLALLKLSDDWQALLTDGTLAPEAAARIVGEEPDIQAEALEKIKASWGDYTAHGVDEAVKSVKAEHERARKRAEMEEERQRRGAQLANHLWYNDRITGKEIEQAEKEGRLVMALDQYENKIIYGRAPKPAAARPDEEAEAAAAERRRIIAGNKEWRARPEARHAFYRELLRRKKTPAGALALIGQALWRNPNPIQYARERHAAAICDLLGITVPEDRKYGYLGTDRALAAHAALSEHNATQVLLATLLIGWEGLLSDQSWRQADTFNGAVLQQLVSWGYQAEAIETGMIPTEKELPDADGKDA